MKNILLFTTNTCTSCKQQKKLMENINYTLIDVSNNNDEYIKKYNLISVPTIIVLENNEEIIRFEGITSIEKINKYL